VSPELVVLLERLVKTEHQGQVVPPVKTEHLELVERLVLMEHQELVVLLVLLEEYYIYRVKPLILGILVMD
jgi:hypothetical protein